VAKTVKTKIVKIGNSQGIRIPKLLLEQIGMSGEVEMVAENDCLILRSVSKRHAWERQFEQMAVAGDDRLLDAETPTHFDVEEWKW